MLDVKQEFLSTKEVAKVLGISESAIVAFRTLGTGPAYIKIGRLCRYPVADLEKWIVQNNPNTL